MESRKMLPMNLFVGKEWRGRCRNGEADVENKLVDTVEEGKDKTHWESGADTHTLSCVK